MRFMSDRPTLSVVCRRDNSFSGSKLARLYNIDGQSIYYSAGVRIKPTGMSKMAVQK